MIAKSNKVILYSLSEGNYVKTSVETAHGSTAVWLNVQFAWQMNIDDFSNIRGTISHFDSEGARLILSHKRDIL